jgi:hypothetical protein
LTRRPDPAGLGGALAGYRDWDASCLKGQG